MSKLADYVLNTDVINPNVVRSIDEESGGSGSRTITITKEQVAESVYNFYASQDAEWIKEFVIISPSEAIVPSFIEIDDHIINGHSFLYDGRGGISEESSDLTVIVCGCCFEFSISIETDSETGDKSVAISDIVFSGYAYDAIVE